MTRRPHAAITVYLTAILLALLAGASASGQTQTWYLDPPHSSAQFSVRHMGISTIRGTFNKVNGVVVDSPDLGKASVNVTIDASSVDTRVEMRDKDLRSDHFFDVAKYPTITFQSKKVESAGQVEGYRRSDDPRGHQGNRPGCRWPNSSSEGSER
jgi:polyisoprenoid-binding protein YceI